MTDKYTFVGISLVDASMIKSQWQAHFIQVFPIDMEKNLPPTHPSDKEFFEEHWEGDNHTTYEQFISRSKK